MKLFHPSRDDRNPIVTHFSSVPAWSAHHLSVLDLDSSQDHNNHPIEWESASTVINSRSYLPLFTMDRTFFPTIAPIRATTLNGLLALAARELGDSADECAVSDSCFPFLSQLPYDNDDDDGSVVAGCCWSELSEPSQTHTFCKCPPAHPAAESHYR